MGSGNLTFSGLSSGGTSGISPEAPDFLIPLSNPNATSTITQKLPKSPKIPKSNINKLKSKQTGKGKLPGQCGKGITKKPQKGKGISKKPQKGKGVSKQKGKGYLKSSQKANPKQTGKGKSASRKLVKQKGKVKSKK